MKVLAAELGQVIQLINMDEVRPLRGGAFLPDIIAAVAQRYRFTIYPKEFSAGRELKFETGVLENPHGTVTIPIRLLQVFSDGFLVSTSNTEDADMVMDDFFAWAIDTFQFRPPLTQIPRRYTSSIVVEFDPGLDRFINRFEQCSEIVRSVLGFATIHVGRITFASDPGMQPLFSWSIEARLGASFEAHRYFSTAPLATPAHLEMLETLERIIAP